MNTKARTLRRSAVAAAVFIALAGAAQAQTSNATLRGSVATAGKAAPNAEVSATNVATGFVLRTHANANGSYTLVGLPPGTYKIVAVADGQRSENTVTLQVGQTADLDLAVGATTTLSTVTVTGAAIVDKKTSEVGTYVTPQQLQRLPQVTRNFLSQADLAPGVNVEYDSEGNVKLRSGASSRGAINVFIDGVGQKDYVMRGGTTGQDRSRGNPFPQSALAEYKVTTQNYKAEFDQVSSAAISAATKSGTNEFHGEVFVDHTAANMRAATPAEQTAGSKSDTSQEQYGVSAGGPIIKDVMHFFVAYEGKQNKDPQTVAFGGGPAVTALLPVSIQGLAGPTQSPFKEDLFFGKINWTLNDQNRIDFSVKWRKEKDRKHLGGVESNPFSSDDTVDEKRFDLKHQFTADTFTNEARITYEDAHFGQVPLSGDVGARYRYFTGTNANTIVEAGGNNYYQNKGQKGFSLQDDFTYTGLDSHIIKIGAKAKFIKVDAIEQFNGTPQYFYDVGSTDPLTPYRVEFGSALNGIGDGSTQSKNKQYGFYIQDDWEVNKKLTLNLGVRYDIETSPTYLNNVTPADVLAALNSQDPGAPVGQTYAQSLALGGVNINDYISNGSNRKTFKKAIQPRLGFSYDLMGDKRSVIFGGYGRSYDRNIFDVMQLERTKGSYPGYAVNFYKDGDPYQTCNSGTPSASCVAWSPSYYQRAALQPFVAGGGGREVDLLKNDLKTPYSDQLSLGIRQSIDVWEAEIAYSHVEQKDGFVFLLGNRQPNGNFYTPPHLSGPPWGSGIPNMGTLILGTNGISSKVDAITLKLDKPYTKSSGWGVTTAYTYSHTRENHNTADDFTYLLDYPDVSWAPFLQSSVVPKHKLVATGTYDLPWNMIVSGKLTLASAKAIRGFNCNGQVNGDCVEDTVKARAYRQFDVSLSKVFTFGNNFNVGLRLDVINVFNYTNWQDYNVAWGAPGQGNVSTPTGTLSGPPRTVKVGLSAGW